MAPEQQRRVRGGGQKQEQSKITTSRGNDARDEIGQDGRGDDLLEKVDDACLEGGGN